MGCKQGCFARINETESYREELAQLRPFLHYSEDGCVDVLSWRDELAEDGDTARATGARRQGMAHARTQLALARYCQFSLLLLRWRFVCALMRHVCAMCHWAQGKQELQGDIKAWRTRP